MLHVTVLSISMQWKYFTALNLSSPGGSHVGSLSTKAAQKKVGSWCNIFFCHTCQPCSWSCKPKRPKECQTQNGSTCGQAFATFKLLKKKKKKSEPTIHHKLTKKKCCEYFLLHCYQQCPCDASSLVVNFTPGFTATNGWGQMRTTLPTDMTPLYDTILVSGLCSMELSPDLTPSFQLYISLQIGSKDASFPVPVAFSSLHCDRCICEGGGWERERVREEIERVYVWVDGFIVECPRSPPPSVYLVLRAND